MYGTNVTLVGNVVDEVTLKPTTSGRSRVQFRVASTRRYRDRDTGQWTDGQTVMIGVTFWREFAENVALSFKKGDPVVLTGKLYSRQFVQAETTRLTFEIEPESFGHNVYYGVSKFDKRRRSVSGSVEVDADGFPVQPDDDGYELMDEVADPGVGAATGGRFSPALADAS